MNEINKQWNMLWSVLFACNLIISLCLWLQLFVAESSEIPSMQILAFIALIIGFFAKLTEYRKTPQAPSWRGLVCLCLISAFIVRFSLFEFDYTWLPRLYIGLAFAYTWAIHGFGRMQVATPLFVLSIFLLPNLQQFWRDLLSVPLQYICAWLTVNICGQFLPIRQVGHFFLINHDSYNVAPSCTGLSMLASFMFGFAVWQTFVKIRPIAYLLVIFLDPLLALALNTLRLVITATCGFLVSQPFAISIHSNLEYGLIPLGLMIMWLLGKKYEVAKT